MSKTSKILEDNGYEVRALNLNNVPASDCWNVLGEIKDESSAMVFASTVIDNTSDGGKGESWVADGQKNLLQALALYVVGLDNESERTIDRLYRELTTTGGVEHLKQIFGALAEDHPAKKSANVFIASAANEKVSAAFVSGLATRLQVLQPEEFRRLLSGDLNHKDEMINIERAGRRKVAFYMVVPDTHSTYDFIAGLFFTFSFINLINFADGTKEKVLPVKVKFLMDEFPNIAKVPDFPKKISTIRSRGVSTSIVFQAIPQLRNRYPDGQAEEILGNCDTKIFLGANDDQTAEFISKILDKATITTESQSDERYASKLFSGSVSKSLTGRELLTIGEVLKQGAFDSLIMLRGQNPIKAGKMDYTKHTRADEMETVPVYAMLKQWSHKFHKKYLEKILKGLMDSLEKQEEDLIIFKDGGFKEKYSDKLSRNKAMKECEENIRLCTIEVDKVKSLILESEKSIDEINNNIVSKLDFLENAIKEKDYKNVLELDEWLKEEKRMTTTQKKRYEELKNRINVDELNNYINNPLDIKKSSSEETKVEETKVKETKVEETKVEEANAGELKEEENNTNEDNLFDGFDDMGNSSNDISEVFDGFDTVAPSVEDDYIEEYEEDDLIQEDAKTKDEIPVEGTRKAVQFTEEIKSMDVKEKLIINKDALRAKQEEFPVIKKDSVIKENVLVDDKVKPTIKVKPLGAKKEKPKKELEKPQKKKQNVKSSINLKEEVVKSEDKSTKLKGMNISITKKENNLKEEVAKSTANNNQPAGTKKKSNKPKKQKVDISEKPKQENSKGIQIDKVVDKSNNPVNKPRKKGNTSKTKVENKKEEVINSDSKKKNSKNTISIVAKLNNKK